MKARINNIGIIKHAEFQLDGLTVITGLNNSGKTTIGKVLFSIFSSVENISYNSLIDTQNYVLNLFSRLFEEISFLGRHYLRTKETKGTSKNIQSFLDVYQKTFSIIEESTDKNQLINALKDFKNDIEELNSEIFFDLGIYHRKSLSNEPSNSSKYKEVIIKTLDKAVKLIDSDKDLVEYANTRIMRYLKSEFNNQVLPISEEEKTAKIEIFDNRVHFFNIKILNDKITDRSFYLSPFKSTFFVDDIYALDKVQEYREEYDRDYAFYRYTNRTDVNLKISDFTKVKKHNDKLVEHILRTENNIYDEIANKRKIDSIIKEINLILPNKISLHEGKLVYSDKKLDIRNLATGSKMFAILKVLLEKGFLTDSTMLILDEPESHLHPKWQNVLAEIIVMLVEKVGLNVLLTTHSPNFLLAIDVFSKKYQIRKKTNFYQSEKHEKGYSFLNINDNINEAYSLMSRPFLELESELY